MTRSHASTATCHPPRVIHVSCRRRLLLSRWQRWLPDEAPPFTPACFPEAQLLFTYFCHPGSLRVCRHPPLELIPLRRKQQALLQQQQQRSGSIHAGASPAGGGPLGEEAAPGVTAASGATAPAAAASASKSLLAADASSGAAKAGAVGQGKQQQQKEGHEQDGGPELLDAEAPLDKELLLHVLKRVDSQPALRTLWWGPFGLLRGEWKPDGESVRLLQHVITTLHLQGLGTLNGEGVAGFEWQGKGGLGLGVGASGGGARSKGLAGVVLDQGSGGMFGRQRVREAQLARLCDEVVELRAMVGGLLEVQREQQRLLQQLLIQGGGGQQGTVLQGQEQQQDRGGDAAGAGAGAGSCGAEGQGKG